MEGSKDFLNIICSKELQGEVNTLSLILIVLGE